MNSGETIYVQRFNAFARILHFFVIISFLTLALTGMCLKFSTESWAQWTASLFGSFRVLGVLHRIAAVITFGYFFGHFILVYHNYRKSGKPLLKFMTDENTGMVPNLRDLQEIGETIKWFLGKGPRPAYGRWTYWEKFDYLAVFWGVAVIGFTGLCLWFPEFATRYLPGWFLNIATIVHSDEALLATGFIFTIHFYNTHLRPEKFPLDKVIFTGVVTLDELKHERPREYEMLVKEGRLEEVITDPPPKWLVIFAYVFGLSAVSIGLSLIFTIFFTLLKYTFK